MFFTTLDSLPFSFDILRCLDCQEMVPEGDLRKYGKLYKCCDCHSSYRYCRDNVNGWNKLSPEEKTNYIVKNKGHGGRGKKRELQSSASVRAFALSVKFVSRHTFLHICPLC